jgi:hypothetical protein
MIIGSKTHEKPMFLYVKSPSGRVFRRFTDSFFLGGVLFTLGAIPFTYAPISIFFFFFLPQKKPSKSIKNGPFPSIFSHSQPPKSR